MIQIILKKIDQQQKKIEQRNFRQSMNNLYEVVEKTENHIIIRVDEYFIEKIDKIIKRIKKKDQKDKNTQNGFMFKRRVIPFFMNQFYIYSRNKNLDVYKFLSELKRFKKSKQKKFELGDLKAIFQNNYESVQELWKQFLINEANNAIDRNMKIAHNYKIQYRKYISILNDELRKDEPYKNFLQKNDDDPQLNLCPQLNFSRQLSQEADERQSIGLLIKQQSSQYQMSLWDDTFI